MGEKKGGATVWCCACSPYLPFRGPDAAADLEAHYDRDHPEQQAMVWIDPETGNACIRARIDAPGPVV